MPAIASTKHTGTRFLRHIFKPKVYQGAHFGEQSLHKLAGHYVITPIRRLDNIIVSWARRDMDLERLHRDLGQMIAFPKDFIFPIDSEDREEYLARLSEILDRELVTDWTPQGRQDKGIKPNPDPELVERIRTDYSEWFEQFYGRNR